MKYRLHCYFTSTNIISDTYRFDNSVVKLINRGKKCEEFHLVAEKSNIYEIVIESSEDKEVIKNIVDLLCCSYTVVSGYNYYICEDVIKQIKPEGEKDDLFWANCNGPFLQDNDCWYYALKLAEMAYGNQSYMNSISRYHSAHEIVNLHYMDLHPYEDPIQETYLLSEQMRIANCIVTCYSSVEEIGIQVSLRKGVSLLNEKKSDFNPEVYELTKNNLISVGIDTNISIPWLARGKYNSTIKTINSDEIELCDWSKGIIKDRYVSPTDALLEIKFLRNRAGAHDGGNFVTGLSVYDAENAFSLSRILLLIKFGIYNQLISN